MRIPIVLICGSVLLSACASVTSDYYSDICATAERNGQLDAAEKACHRALTDVDWGGASGRNSSLRSSTTSHESSACDPNQPRRKIF